MLLSLGDFSAQQLVQVPLVGVAFPQGLFRDLLVTLAYLGEVQVLEVAVELGLQVGRGGFHQATSRPWPSDSNASYWRRSTGAITISVGGGSARPLRTNSAMAAALIGCSRDSNSRSASSTPASDRK